MGIFLNINIKTIINIVSQVPTPQFTYLLLFLFNQVCFYRIIKFNGWMNPKFLAHYTDAEDKYIYDFFSKVKSVYPTVWNIFI